MLWRLYSSLSPLDVALTPVLTWLEVETWSDRFIETSFLVDLNNFDQRSKVSSIVGVTLPETSAILFFFFLWRRCCTLTWNCLFTGGSVNCQKLLRSVKGSVLKVRKSKPHLHFLSVSPLRSVLPPVFYFLSYFLPIFFYFTLLVSFFTFLPSFSLIFSH